MQGVETVEARPVIRARPAPVFEFEDLSAMPCGCVTAAYRAARWEVSLVSIEAKGPYCPRPNHFVGQVLELGEPLEEEAEPRAQAAAG
jgi:hypothetical protein